MELVDLQAFVDVVSAGSFSEASRRTGTPKSTLSRRVSRLEEDLRLTLVYREPRLRPTPDGEHLHRVASAPLRELEEAEHRMLGLAAEPHGTLRVNAPHDIGSQPFFAEGLAEYCRRCPGVQVEVSLGEQGRDLLAHGIDVALRPRAEQAFSGLMTRRAQRIVGGVFAAPEFEVQGLEAPDLTADLDVLKRVPVLSHGGLRQPGRWRLVDGSGSAEEVNVRPRIVANDFNLLAQGATAGIGVALLPLSIGERLVGAGRLRRWLPDWSFGGGELWLLWPQSRHLTPRVRHFVEVFGGSQPAAGIS